MKALSAVLQTVASETVAGQYLCRRLRLHGVHARLTRAPAVPCLRFRLSRSDGELIGRVPVSSWAAHHLPHLPGLDWCSLEPAQLHGLCNMDAPIRFNAPGLEYAFAELVSLDVKHVDDIRYAEIDAVEGKVQLERLDWTLEERVELKDLPSTLALPLRMRLARVRMPMRQLIRLQSGDIVLLPQLQPQAWRGPRRLFDFRITPEAFIVNQIHFPSHDEVQASAAGPADTAPSVRDLADLPLTLDVQLCQLDMPLAEIMMLQSGSTLVLPEQSFRAVRILHNGHCLIRGTLVQVGETLGVELTQAPRLK